MSLTPQDLERELLKANQDASDRRTRDAMIGVALIIGVPILVVFLFVIGG